MDNPIGNNIESFKGFFIENVSKFCDKCGTAYKTDNIDIVSETNVSLIIQAQCDNCKGIYMAHVIKPLQMTKKIPVRLDISPLQLQEYYSLGAIGSDELLMLRRKIVKTSSLRSVMEIFGQKEKIVKQKKTSEQTSVQA
jgi:hypothetical protein